MSFFLFLLLLLLQRFVCSTLDLQLADLHDVSEVAFIFIGKEFHVSPKRNKTNRMGIGADAKI